MNPESLGVSAAVLLATRSVAYSIHCSDCGNVNGEVQWCAFSGKCLEEFASGLIFVWHLVDVPSSTSTRPSSGTTD